MIKSRTPGFTHAHGKARRVLASILFCVLLLQTTAVSAATAKLRGADNVPVSRGDFLKAVVDTLGVTLPKADTSLPYLRVSTSMQPYVAYAHQKGALTTFGNSLQLSKKLTRIEAAILLAKLTGAARKTTGSGVSFSDVRGALQQESVQIVVDQQWMRGSGNLFGSQKTLSTREAKLILARIVPAGKVKITVPITRIKPANSVSPINTNVMDEVWRLLNQEYLYKERLDGAKAGNKAIQSLVETLNDPYTVYMPPANAQRFNDQIKGEVDGIGATVEIIDGVVRVVAPIRGSPAEKAGVLPKDEILSVDGKLLKDMSLDEAVGIIRGPKGSTAKLRIRRNGVEMDINVVRETIKIPEVEITKQGDITIIRVAQFGDATDTKLGDYMKQINETHPKGIVIDLRDNPGGLLHAAGVLVGHFLPKGSVFAVINGRDGSYKEKTTIAPTIDSSVKVVVLVNHGSASASEIVVGALQDAKRATIVGQKTYGKGTVQEVVQFNDNSSLKFTIAEWLTPLERKINGLGIEPDIVVEHESGRDAELLKALDLLR